MPPILPDSHSPFNDTSALVALGIDPFLSQDDLASALDKVSAAIANLPEGERNKRQTLVAEAGKLLRNPRQRTLTVFRHFDRPGVGTLRQQLTAAAAQQVGSALTLRDPGMAQVFIEGQSVPLAQRDFAPLDTDPALLLSQADLGQVPVSDTAEPILDLDL